MERITLKPPEAAEYLGICYAKLLAESKSGNIPHFRIGRKFFYKLDALDGWIEQQMAEPVQQVPETKYPHLTLAQ